MSARTPRKKKSHTSACVYISAACTRQHTKTYDHRTHTPEQNVPTKKNAHSSTSVRFFHSALWGHCVLCVNVSGIYLLGGGIKVSGGGGSVRACVLVVAMVCVCVCVCACAGGDDACARVRAFVCSCWR